MEGLLESARSVRRNGGGLLRCCVLFKAWLELLSMWNRGTRVVTRGAHSRACLLAE